jgi:hypothetical protein
LGHSFGKVWSSIILLSVIHYTQRAGLRVRCIKKICVSQLNPTIGYDSTNICEGAKYENTQRECF